MRKRRKVPVSLIRARTDHDRQAARSRVATRRTRFINSRGGFHRVGDDTTARKHLRRPSLGRSVRFLPENTSTFSRVRSLASGCNAPRGWRAARNATLLPGKLADFGDADSLGSLGGEPMNRNRANVQRGRSIGRRTAGNAMTNLSPRTLLLFRVARLPREPLFPMRLGYPSRATKKPFRAI